MSKRIYSIQDNDELIEMSEQDYDSEDLLQTLLAKYPNLLAGEEIDSINPRKWILVSREMNIPDHEKGKGRWYVDHLYIDQDGIPTLIEVKRSSDTRIRREVIGQLLEYGANAHSYWRFEDIRAQFEAGCESEDARPEDKLQEHLEIDVEYQEFWERVKTNLDIGRIRLLFVADLIPFELRTVVEYLNDQMKTTEVLALEIRQYVGENQRTLVPRIIGQTTKAFIEKSTVKKKQWTEEAFLRELDSKTSIKTQKLIRNILEWTKSTADEISWSKAATGSFYFRCIKKEVSYTIISADHDGWLNVHFAWLIDKKVAQEKLEKLRSDLLGIPHFKDNRVLQDEGFFDRRRGVRFRLNGEFEVRDIDKFIDAISQLIKAL